MDMPGMLNDLRRLWREVAALKALRPAPLDAWPQVSAGRFRVVDNEQLSPNHFLYDLQRVKPGAASHSGLDVEEEIFKARNTEEELSFGGYSAGSVTGIRPIANGRIVECWWSTRREGSTTERVLLFTRDNEPIC